MYAAVQHVKASNGNEGVNSFLHEGGRGAPGNVRHQFVEVHPPSGNSVESYLDVEYADGTLRSQIEALLISLTMAASQNPPRTIVLEWPGVARAEFSTTPRHDDRRRQELETLKRHILALPL